MYSLNGVVWFVANHREQFGSGAPRVLSRAFALAEELGGGIIPNSAVSQVFVASAMADWFKGESLMNTELRAVHIAGANGSVELNTGHVLFGLFGHQPPADIARMIGERRYDSEVMNDSIVAHLALLGVVWQKHWLRFDSRSVAQESQPAG